MNKANNYEDWTADESNEDDDDVSENSEVDEDQDDEDSDETDDEGEIYTSRLLRQLDYTQSANYQHLMKSVLLEIKEALERSSEVSYSNAIALNKLMQDKLSIVRSNLMLQLEQIKVQYAANEEKIKTTMKHKVRQGIGMRGAYLKGGTFYFKGNMFFKDANNRNCPNNPDYTYRSEVAGEMFPMDFELRGRHVWTVVDKVNIVRGVKEQVVDYLERREKNLTKDRSIEEQNSLHTKKLGNLLEQVDKNFQIDWELISIINLKYRHSACSANAMWNVYLQPSLKRGPWKEEENNRLLQAAKKYNYQDWQSIARDVGHRSDYQCFVQYHNRIHFLTERKINKWSKDEDRRLIKFVNAYTVNGVINWNAVASRFPNRSKMRCVARYYYSLDPKISHEPFTPEEDLTLLAAVQEYGENNFGCIPRTLFPNRSTTQLRSRYKNTLIHRHKIGIWTNEEDKKLMDFVAEYGPSSWTKCANMLGTHTRTSCRTRFLTIKRFLEKNPGADLDKIPTKVRSADNVITPNNWAEKITELQNDPTVCLKRRNKRKEEELKRREKALMKAMMGKSTRKRRGRTIFAKKLRSIELKMYTFFKYSYNFKFGIDPCTRPLREPHALALVQVACGFRMFPERTFIRDSTLPSSVAQSCEKILSKASNPKIANREQDLRDYRLPPSWATLMGFRALCVLSAQALPQQDMNDTKIENIEPIQTFRQRLRVLFYKTGLLSRLNPETIHGIKTKYKSQISAMSNVVCNTETKTCDDTLHDMAIQSRELHQREKRKENNRVSKDSDDVQIGAKRKKTTETVTSTTKRRLRNKIQRKDAETKGVKVNTEIFEAVEDKERSNIGAKYFTITELS